MPINSERALPVILCDGKAENMSSILNVSELGVL